MITKQDAINMTLRLKEFLRVNLPLHSEQYQGIALDKFVSRYDKVVDAIRADSISKQTKLVFVNTPVVLSDYFGRDTKPPIMGPYAMLSRPIANYIYNKYTPDTPPYPPPIYEFPVPLQPGEDIASVPSSTLPPEQRL